ncbi:MAG: hypothetical protein MZV65_49245 [Chromatiales bacterium]|nr:hypothetical protein [Chromatiales bacterium]
MLASVLLDLSQTATLEDSERAASQPQGVAEEPSLAPSGSPEGRLRGAEVAGYSFLLIETAFISNPDEERIHAATGRRRRWLVRFFTESANTLPMAAETRLACEDGGGKPVVIAAQP